MSCYQPINNIGILPSSAAEFQGKKKEKRLRYDWHRGELSCWAIKECGESSCVSQSSHHYFQRKIWVTASVSVVVWVADGTYACTDAFEKLKLSRGANQHDSVFVASSHRSHACTLTAIDKDHHFLCSIDVCSAAVSDPMWPKTTNQQKLGERIFRSRLMVGFYAVKPGGSDRTDNISLRCRTQPVKILQQTLKGLLLNRVWSRNLRGCLWMELICSKCESHVIPEDSSSKRF